MSHSLLLIILQKNFYSFVYVTNTFPLLQYIIEEYAMPTLYLSNV